MHTLSALQIHERFMQGIISAKEIALYFLARTKKDEGLTDAFLTLFPETVLRKAEELDQRREQGLPLGKMAAVPVAIKDNIHIHGELTTCASKILANYRAVFDATVIRRLKEEDAFLVGKTNLDEFAMGSSTEQSAFQKTKNPWNLACSPGGSSGGSSAAVAARYVPLALGSDTGGSIRQPAALTGTVGFKPTYGRVSRYGLVAFASSLDQIGPIANCVADVAYILEVISASCDKDSTSLRTSPPAYLSILQTPLKESRIGVPWRFLDGLSAEARSNFEEALDVLRGLGATLVEVDLNLLKYSVAIYSILATAEASTNLARYDGIRYGVRAPTATTLHEIYDLTRQQGFGTEVKNRILLGTYVLSSGYHDAYYKKAQQVRTLLIHQFQQAFSQCDLIAMPSSPLPAFPLGSMQDPIQMYLQDLYTIGANLAGLPAISVPSGWSHDKKPYGLQLIGPQLDDEVVLQMAYQFEKASPENKQIPPLFDKELL
ncbi:MAG: Asp-tRNA(Asn)/Glu-tRNA(Gln) amidotransferase subunit GatA [Chlamydiae bacterium]|nr:Asp-tRNA(Asn)/Glu-tRNA(Gln) amidotransferase subunit GatA [Chlamydiota bacterium]